MTQLGPEAEETLRVLADGVRAGRRAVIAQAITLVESRRIDHRELAQRLLAQLLPDTGSAVRVGISGVPGVGKSTFIDTLGMNLVEAGHKVAVLAVDPSSSRTGGSILGDKTRMVRLAAQENAFIRPSPSAGTLGGVAQATRETMLIMEAAGYDVVLIETVGVGQSEYVVAEMVDTFLFLTLARTGDQLQGMKRGILELADVIAVNKADEQHEGESARAARELSAALRLLRGPEGQWQTPVVTCSGLHNLGLDELWRHIERHRDWLVEHGDGDGTGSGLASGAGSGSGAGGTVMDGLTAKRRRQLVDWTRAMVRDRLLSRLESPPMRAVVADAESRVLAGEITPDRAAAMILAALDGAATSGDPNPA